MTKPNIERNFNDFKKEIEEVKTFINECSFKNHSIESLESMFDSVDSLITEWNHLESDIEEAISFIDNIEE